MNTSRLLFTHALSPLHPGTGQGVGVIDLPIAREKATGIPYLPGSSVKGVLRYESEADNETKKKVFGPERDKDQDPSENAGMLHLSDQRLLLLPVRSFSGTFAWVTCPYVLARFSRDITASESGPFPELLPELKPSFTGCLVSCESDLTNTKPLDGKVYLEDLDFKSEANVQVDAWAKWIGERIFLNDQHWQKAFVGRFCVVGDDVFNFLTETATEVVARIKLQDETKTVEQGALWYEESLPAETILQGLAVTSPIKEFELETQLVHTVLEKATARPLQFGGKASVGRGLCRLILVGNEGAA